MSSVETLVTNATARANYYAGATDSTVATLRSFLLDRGTELYLPGSFDEDGNYIRGLDLSTVYIPQFVTPSKDATAMPVYEPPNTAIPSAPTLADISAVTIPTKRVEPVLNIDELFTQVAPSQNLPDFSEAEPDLGIDDLVKEMTLIAAPTLNDIEVPSLTALSIGSAPTLVIPDFNALMPPDDLRDPVDYAQSMSDTYASMAPEMQGFIDSKVSGWVGQFAPEYFEWTADLRQKINDAMSGEVLSEQYESALITRARTRVDRDYSAVEQGLFETYSRSGFMEPPGAVISALQNGRLKNAEALAAQSTEIYIKRREMEVQHLQFILTLSSSQVQSVRNLAINYANMVGNTMQQAVAYASSLSDKLGKIFDHLLARSEMRIKVMNTLASQYEIELKAALSGMEGFKIELEVEKLKKDVELSQIKFIESQLGVQDQKIKRYTALIDAVSRKASMEEIKLKGYEIRADVFKNQTTAKLASFDAYKAAIDGDKAKLDGELSKIQVYESLIKTDQMNLDAQVKALQAVSAHNDAKVKIFQSSGDVYQMEADAALKKFSTYAEVKKLTQSIYGQELSAAIDAFKANLEIPKIMLDAKIKEYELSVQTAIEEAKIDTTKLQIAEKAAEAAADAYKSMAAASLGSLNTMSSIAVQAAS